MYIYIYIYREREREGERERKGSYAVFLAFLGFVWWAAWRLSLSKV